MTYGRCSWQKLVKIQTEGTATILSDLKCALNYPEQPGLLWRSAAAAATMHKQVTLHCFLQHQHRDAAKVTQAWRGDPQSKECYVKLKYSLAVAT